jgi:predicted ArsR family transcriptional regulator
MLSRGERCVTGIVEELRIDGKTVKYHLDILESSGLVEHRLKEREKILQAEERYKAGNLSITIQKVFSQCV